METTMSSGRVLAGIYLCAFACIAGCGIREYHSIDALDIQPSVLDLGTVAVTGQQVSAKFTLKNNGSKKVDVQLTSACSCVVAGSPFATLRPQQTDQFELLISTHGRSGDFRTEIAVDALGKSHRLPIKAVFVPEVYAFPSRVVFYPSDSSGNELIGSVSISAPVELWQELQLQVEDGYRIDGDELGAKRQFRISYDGPTRKLHPSIVVRKKNQEYPVLNIPAISGLR
jgi:Protein of unknown function (DUF1573)